MTAGTAWSVRGVDDDTREAAIEAARQSGLSVGEWLRTVLADESATPAHRDTSEPGDPIAQLDQRLQHMEQASLQAFEALKRQLEKRSSPASAPAAVERSPTSVSQMVAALARELDATDEDARSEIESGRVRPATPAPQHGEPNQRMSAAELNLLSNRLGGLLATNDQPVTSAHRIEAALRKLENRIDSAKSTMAAREPAPRPQHRPPAAQPPAPVAQPAANPDPLLAAIDEITHRQSALDARPAPDPNEPESAALSAAIGAIRNDVAALSEQIQVFGRDSLEDRAAYADLARRIDALATEAPLDRREIDALRQELHGLLKSLSESTNVERARLDELGEEVSALRREMTANREPEAFHVLQTQIDELGGMVNSAVATVANGIDPRQVNQLEHRVEGLTARIEELIAHAPSPDALDALRNDIATVRREITVAPAFDPSPMEADIRDLASRVESLARTGGREGLNDLEARVGQIAAELEHNGLRSETLNRVEAGLADMQAHLASSEQQSLDAARAAAMDVVRDMAANGTRDDAEAEIVRGLKNDLESLKLAAGDTGRTTEESLASVNQTIAQVLSRLTQLEAADTGGADASDAGAVVARAPLAPVTSAPEPATVEPSQLSSGTEAEFTPVFKEPAPAETAGSTIAMTAADAAGGPAEPTVKDARARRADFIAAARRAAQAAASESVSATRSAAAKPTGDDDADAAAAKDGPFKRITRALHGRKKALVLAAAAIVIAVGAMQLYGDVTRGQSTSLIAATDQTAGPTPIRDLPVVNEVAPIAGAGAAALVPPAAQFEPDMTFSEPATAASAFVKQPPVSDAPTAFAKPTSGSVDILDEAARSASEIGPPDLFAAAETGDAEAAFEIGQRYADGVRVERNMELARVWFEKAATGGLAVAQYRLGSLYERGVGGQKNLVAAGDWYQRAADQGNINAMHNLAVLMSEGIEGAPDHLRAIQWFLAAAEYGVKDSQYNLGVLYARGIGQAQNLVESYKWFALAALAGDSDAALRRDEVAENLGPEDLGRARAAVQAWSKREPLLEANSAGTTWSDARLVDTADQQALVQKIQILLADQGFDPGPQDGVIGPRTRDAVLAFQRRYGLTATGRIDQSLIAALTSTTS